MVTSSRVTIETSATVVIILNYGAHVFKTSWPESTANNLVSKMMKEDGKTKILPV